MTRKVSGFLICLLAVLPLIVGASRAVAAPPQPSNPSFSQIAGCISGADNLLVSVVVDESASLRSTDPQALRVEGITTAVDSIGQLAESTPSLNVEMSLSTFARGYAHLAAWKRLTQAFAADLRISPLANYRDETAVTRLTTDKRCWVPSKTSMRARSNSTTRTPASCCCGSPTVLWMSTLRPARRLQISARPAAFSTA